MNNYFDSKDRTMIVTPLCLSRESASTDIHDDIDRARSKFDLKSKSHGEPSRSY